MDNFSTYIWGIRNGFKANEALFPERARLDASQLKEYESVVKNFDEKKDALFRLCNKDFYFLMRDTQNRIYSLVISDHTDISDGAGRKAFLVVSLVCPQNKVISGDIITALHKLKKLYQTKNADNTIDRNLFTQDHINEQISGLGISDAGYKNSLNNTLILFEEGNLHNDYLNQIGGDEVYFIPQGSNSEMIASKGFIKTIKLEDEIRKSKEGRIILNEFLALFANKSEQNYTLLKELYAKCKDLLDPVKAAEFTEWERKLNKQNQLNDNLNKLRLELTSAQNNNFSGDPSKLLNILALNPELKVKLTSEEVKQIEQWTQSFEQKQESDLLNKITFELAQAKSGKYKKDPKVVDDLLAKRKSREKLSDSLLKDIETWKKTYNNERKTELLSSIIALEKEIKKAGRSEKLKNENTWLKKISEFKDLAEVLGDSTIKKSEHFAYLQSEKWKTSKLPFLKISTAAIISVLLIVGGIIIGPKYWGGQQPVKVKSIDTTPLISAYDSLYGLAMQRYENKLYALAEQTFQQAIKIADTLVKTNDNELTKKRINDVTTWIEKCKVASKPLETQPSTNNSSSTQLPATVKTPAAEESKKKEDALKLKAAEEAKRKAEKEAELKTDADKKGANKADDEWDKIPLNRSNITGDQVVSKEKAIEIWNSLKNKQPPLKEENVTKWRIVKAAKQN
jgi:hypothetical protein